MFFSQSQVTEEDKEALEKLTGLADQLVAMGDYSILLYFITKQSATSFEDFLTLSQLSMKMPLKRSSLKLRGKRRQEVYRQLLFIVKLVCHTQSTTQSQWTCLLM